MEQRRAEYGDANSLFLSDSGNIGVSPFASTPRNEQPTIDIRSLLAASGVGNHEFDRGLR